MKSGSNLLLWILIPHSDCNCLYFFRNTTANRLRLCRGDCVSFKDATECYNNRAEKKGKVDVMFLMKLP